MHHLKWKPWSPWPHSVAVYNIKLVWMKEKYPAWSSGVAFVQRKSRNCKLNFSCNSEAGFPPPPRTPHTGNTVKSGKEITNLSPLFWRRAVGCYFQDYLLPNDFWSVLFTCRTSWYFWTEQRTLLHILSVQRKLLQAFTAIAANLCNPLISFLSFTLKGQPWHKVR